MSNRKFPRTTVEVIEELPKNVDKRPGGVRVKHVLINGQRVLVAKDGIHIDYDRNLDAPHELLRDGLVSVTVELLVDEFSIKQVPHGYTGGKTSTSTGAHLHFSGHVHGMSEEQFAEEVNRKRRIRKLTEDFNNDDFD